MSDGPTTTTTSRLSTDDVSAVLALVDEASVRDGYAALNEAALLHLRHPRTGVQHLLARHGGQLVGYAQLDSDQPSPGADAPAPAPTDATSTGQLVVAADRRRAGVGSALLAALLAEAPSPLRIWAMGDTDAARALAAASGLHATRTLLVMSRSLSTPWPDRPLPPGVTLRTFVVGQDEDAWLAVNARAFAHHPEQGQLMRTDLADRMAEDWFDPSGFLLAVRDDALLGFHWTKQHPAGVGEVYVLGVDPDSGGRGLGQVLLSRGLASLRDRGSSSVELYVEADHERAVGLYTRYGFVESSRDVMYAQS